MSIKAIVISSFVHGALSLRRGDEAEFSEPTFAALAAHGLVRAKDDPSAGAVDQAQPPARTTRAARPPSNKRAPDPLNKSASSDAPAVAGGTTETGAPDGAATEEATGTQNADATSTAQATETTNGPGADDAAANT